MEQQHFTDERSLFAEHDLVIKDCIFDEGESPLKESKNIKLYGSMFRYKYPLWYSEDIETKDTAWTDMARAGVWYTKRITVEDALIEAPKNFRRCDELTLKNVTFTDAKETLWSCTHTTLENVQAKGTYFAMNCEDLNVTNLRLSGDYSFDGVRRATIKNSVLLSKDAFWNTEDVTVEDSFISGEYLGWNAKNLTLINCTIESLQGMCYIENLVMKNCKLLNTTLAFEYSSVDAEITSRVESVLNPKSGTIRAPYIDRLIIEKDYCDEGKTKILCDDIGTRKDKNDEL